MKNLIILVIVVAGGYFVYTNYFQKAPDVRLADALRNRWFSQGANQTGMAAAVDHFEVDKNLHVKVFLTETYQNLPGTQKECMDSIVAIVRSETLQGRKATIDFIYRDSVIAKTEDDSYTIKMQR